MSEIAEIVCMRCAVVFRHEVPRSQSLPGFCGDECRRAARKEREKARNERRVISPLERFRGRERNRARAAQHRGVARHQPWLAGAPPYDRHLPGVAMTVDFDPRPTRAIRLCDTRGLHGALTALLDMGHETHKPNFALYPSGVGWIVHWWKEDGARFAGRTVEGTLWDRPTRFTFGPGWRMKAPPLLPRGHGVVRVDTVTPVVSRSMGSTVYKSRPSAANFVSMLGAEFAHRLGVEYLHERELLMVREVEIHTQPARVDLGTHLGSVVGWEGYVVLDMNAPARWLLRATERVGLGGRTAFGFGRIRVTDLGKEHRNGIEDEGHSEAGNVVLRRQAAG